ncbi:hypothetical protein AAFF_G00285270 [Aldrovandia affinis]|uniref:Uncharacterized protein n=1 Tax=Aldrovandia affinis TaxID=143900 RepID=A0AAD7X1X9_9TELE|nr:hypothetical protein AAFF_G00285270 [Aldrovandia affinis]
MGVAPRGVGGINLARRSHAAPLSSRTKPRTGDRQGVTRLSSLHGPCPFLSETKRNSGGLPYPAHSRYFTATSTMVKRQACDCRLQDGVTAATDAPDLPSSAVFLTSL